MWFFLVASQNFALDFLSCHSAGASSGTGGARVALMIGWNLSLPLTAKY